MAHEDVIKQLEQRLGRVHTRMRLGIESESGHRVFGGGINFFHPENWYSTHSLIRFCLRISGLYQRGMRNARNIQVRHNAIHLPHLPRPFEGFTILHLSDLHADMDRDTTHAIADAIRDLEYDICVLTGDYRASTFGDYETALEGMQRITLHLRQPVYGVLGNHDSVRMVPGLEAQGVTMLLNESVLLERGDHHIALAGIDDAHYFRVNNLEKTVQHIPEDMISILLSHTPEIYRQAVHAAFDVMLAGHTHGGQICLPGGIPLTLDAKCPRYMGSGQWRYRNMIGYTSVGAGTSIVNVRLNCLPEVTLHRLHAGD
ncbi:MAG: metallophosphoesterase [Gammaproteobacteria bacterium]